ncbi:MAG TPA: hypothetical protein VMH86_08785 [Rhizomicrobium sp.]|nr:hypothetical protein [Rhizomicrobium sp.]
MPAAPENFVLAIPVGLAVAVAGALAWAVVTVVTNFQIGIMALAVGYAVGRAIKAVGHGRSQKFGMLGAACAFFGCLLGNLFSAIGIFAQQEHLDIMNVVAHATPDLLFALMKGISRVMDIVFYGIAIYEGFRFSFDP